MQKITDEVKRKRLPSIHDPRYRKMVSVVVKARKQAGISQSRLANQMGFSQPHVSKAENIERRIDILELFDMVRAISAGDSEIEAQIWGDIVACHGKP